MVILSTFYQQESLRGTFCVQHHLAFSALHCKAMRKNQKRYQPFGQYPQQKVAVLQLIKCHKFGKYKRVFELFLMAT